MKPTARYDRVAVFLHWAIALLILLMLPLGLTMGGYNVEYKFLAYNLHKSIGMSILVLSLFRLYWRFTHKAPPLPDHMTSWEKAAAKATHWTFYFLMIAMPLSGWIMVSADAKFPTVYFTLFEVPEFPLPLAYDTKEMHEAFAGFHYWLAIGSLMLIAMHVAAALKHQFINHDYVMRRMLPLWVQRRGRVVL